MVFVLVFVWRRYGAAVGSPTRVKIRTSLFDEAFTTKE